MKNISLVALLFGGLVSSVLAQTPDHSSPKSISEYFKEDTLLVVRRAFYNKDRTQRVEYHCEDENGPGGANEGASNPANQHCEATLFTRQSNRWMYSDEIDLRYGSVEKFSGYELVVKMLDYGSGDALCCPSESWTEIFNTGNGKFAKDDSKNKKAIVVEAIKGGADQKRVAELLGSGSDINAKDEHGQTALTAAIENKDVALATYLVEHRADINARQNNGRTPLIAAAENGSTEIAKLLLDKGAKPNIQSNEGKSALFYAIESGSRDLALLLIQKDADVNAKTKDGLTPLRVAVGYGNEDIARLLLERGADLHATYQGSTILVSAAVGSKCKMVRLLLEKGASANEVNWGDPVFARAAAYTHDTDCLQALLDKGADINGKNGTGETPLYMAATYGSVTNVEWLLKHGADPRIVAYDMTPLESARKIGNKKVVEFLEKQMHR